MRTTAALLTTLLLAANAYAAESGEPEHNGPCKADVQKLCPDVKPGQGRIRACMKEHKDQLSDACKSAIKTRHEQREEQKEKSAEGGNAPTSNPTPAHTVN